MSGLIAELKRRNIFRVITVYAVASWVILQLADITFPALDLPESDIRYVIIALLVAFPFVVGFAWLFELTPAGIQRSVQVERDHSITGQTGRKIDFFIIGLLSVALLFFMNEYFSTDDPVVPELADVIPEPEPPAKPTIAVLPMVNMSSDLENEHFADGLTEELLNVLARNEQLQVAGRTSSFFYKGKNINLKQIGQELNVENILEGSVRKSGDTVRVTAQLINAETGYHLWSETFDRQITDIFAIQDEIAKRVGEAMNLTLIATNSSLPGATTSIPAAHDAFLKAKSLLYDRRRASIEEAIVLFEQSIDLDRSYGPPLIGLAEAVLVAQNNFRTYDLTESAELAKDALDRAAAIGYMPSEYYSTLGLLHHHLAEINPDDVALALAAYEKAIELNGNNVSAYIWYATLITEDMIMSAEVDSIDRVAQATQLNQMALKIDPKNRVANGNLQINLVDNGQLDLAIENLTRLALADPDYEAYQSTRANFLAMKGEYTLASDCLVKTEGMSARETWLVNRIIIALNRKDLLERFIDGLDDDNPLFDRLNETYEAYLATPEELIAKAQVALLRPDYDGWSGPLAVFLYQKGEYRWARKLLENSFPEYKKETPRLRLAGNNLATYASTLYLSGEVGRAQTLAQQGLDLNRNIKVRLGPGGKWLNDAVYYLILDRPEEAIIEVEAAYVDGWRQYYLMVADDPIFGQVLDDPRMLAVKRKVDDHNKRHESAVERNLILAGVISPLPTPIAL